MPEHEQGSPDRHECECFERKAQPDPDGYQIRAVLEVQPPKRREFVGSVMQELLSNQQQHGIQHHGGENDEQQDAHEFAGMILDKQLRMGRPAPIDGLAEAVTGPAFATCAGLLNYAVNNRAEGSGGTYRPVEEPSGRLDRFGQWIRENF